jgi:lysophospholipase L1-like esterase
MAYIIYQMRTLLVVSALLAQGLLSTATAQTEKWIPTWVTAQQAPRSLGPARAGTFSGAFNNQTARMVLRTSIAGHRVRISLSNAYGAAPLTVGAVHIALRSKDSAITAGSDKAVTFNGKPGCSIPVGAFLLSDPIAFEVPKLGDLAISVYVPGDTGIATTHSVGLHTTYIKGGDTTGAADMADGTTTAAYYWLASVEVAAPANTAAVVTFGDSITDGTRSTPNANAAWPSYLAQRLNGVAVLNEGISANRVLRDGFGVSALARWNRDVLSLPGVKWVTVLEGINDIGAGTGPDFIFTRWPHPGVEPVTADELIGAYKQMIERAHEHGIKVYGSPLTPFEGASYYSDHGNETRQTVNQWIRTSKAFDAVIDFDAVVKDPAQPNKFKAEFDSGDHLHPNDAGYKAMADAVGLALFK